MTSANLSLAKFFKEQRALTGRRLPLAALSILMYFLYDVLGTALAIQRERSVEKMYNDVQYALETWPARGARMVSNWMGFRGAVPIITVVGAVLLGIQGFAYLYRSQTVDFYETRPEKRSKRFLDIVLNSFFIYAIPSLLGAILSWLLSVGSGCAAGWVLEEIMLAWLVQTVMFLAVYAMSTLASLLTGTVVTAVLMNAFFFGIEALARITIYLHRAAYYATFDGEGERILNSFITLPPYHYMNGIAMLTEKDYSSYSWETIQRALPVCAAGAAANLLIFAVFMALAFVVYRARKAEFAGASVTYRPVAVAVKFSAAVLFSLCAGMFIYWIFGDGGRGMELPSVIITILVTIFVGCAILESIFAMNIRRAFYRLWHVPVIAAVALSVLFVYREDAFGYDRWLPDESEVESAWIFNSEYSRAYYNASGGYVSPRDYCYENMRLTDTADLLTLAEIAQENQVRNVKGELDRKASYGWGATLGWRLKNGRTVTRVIMIPESIDPKLMDRIMGGGAFAKGAYQMISLDEAREIRDSRNEAAKLVLSVNTEHGHMENGLGDGALYEGFMEAYERDVEKSFDFSMTSYNAPVGSVQLVTSGSGTYFGLSFPLYEVYEETIAYLEKNGLWPGGFLTPDEIERIDLTRYSYDDETGEYTSEVTAVTDRDEIRQVMDASLPMTFQSAWIRYGDIYAAQAETGELAIEMSPRADKELMDIAADDINVTYDYDGQYYYYIGTDVIESESVFTREFVGSDIPEFVKKLAE